MTIYQRMQAVFQAAGIKGYLQTRETSAGDPSLPDAYCDYVVSSDGSALSADDGELAHRYDVYVDLHGKRDVSETLALLLQSLEAAGFIYAPVRHLDGMRGSKYKYHKRIVATHFAYEMED